MSNDIILTQFGNSFINVFVLGVTKHPNEDKLVVHIQDRNGYLKIVKCNSIEQMMKGYIVFDKSFEIITEDELEPC